MITSLDKKFMEIALEEARQGAVRGDFPVGAVLVFDNEIIDKGNNFNYTNEDWVSHAEASLIRKFAPAIQRRKKKEGIIKIYTTLEPCLMCLGTAVLNRVGRIVYACPDPNGGATGLDTESLTPWYRKKWPVIETGIFREESYQLLFNYMKEHESWAKTLIPFEEMHKRW